MSMSSQRFLDYYTDPRAGYRPLPDSCCGILILLGIVAAALFFYIGYELMETHRKGSALWSVGLACVITMAPLALAAFCLCGSLPKMLR